MLNVLLPLLIGLALLLAVIGAVRRIRLWRNGRPSPVALLAGLVAMPRRYLVDLHHVVARDKFISHTHVATAGGFVLAAVLAILVHGLQWHSAILAWALLLATAAMFCGALWVAKRRINPPSRLSNGPWMRLPKSLLASFWENPAICTASSHADSLSARLICRFINCGNCAGRPNRTWMAAANLRSKSS